MSTVLGRIGLAKAAIENLTVDCHGADTGIPVGRTLAVRNVAVHRIHPAVVNRAIRSAGPPVPLTRPGRER